jgi:Lipocalin-like domain
MVRLVNLKTFLMKIIKRFSSSAVIPICIFLVVLIAGSLVCNISYGQSVVGKWKQVSGKMYCTPEAVKNSHGHLQEVMDMPKVDAVDDFKSDHTLTETINSGATKTSTSGTWSMSGNTVTISLTGHEPMKGIVSATDNSLVYTVDMPKSEHMQVIKRVWSYTKV